MTSMRLWPDETEQLLLIAALVEGEPARGAFVDWLQRVDFDGPIEGGSFRLLPLVYSNLMRVGFDDPLMARLRGIYRYSWCEAQTHLRRGGEAISILRRAGMDAMISKGLALAVDFYPSAALRPMSDIDLYVPRERAADALAVLREGGWHSDAQVARYWRERGERDLMELAPGIALYHPLHGELDLHWRLHQDFASSAADERFWTRAVPCTIGGVATVRPSTSDLLFHVLVHGLRPNIMSPIRWVVDAAMILRREAGNIDWGDLLAFASRMRLKHRIASGLEYLRDHVGAAVPAEAVAARPSLVEAIEQRAFQSNLARQGGDSEQSLLNFLAFVARFATNGNRRHLPRHALRWTRRRLLPTKS